MTLLKPKPMQKGNLFIGAGEEGRGQSIKTERHAITIAGSQAGKGVGVIVPNLLSWQDNALVIDPKGEAAKLTAQARAEMGCPSFVFDPFNKADVPENLRVTINPLDRLDPESFTITEDISVVSDGLVKESNADSAYWDKGARTIISGLIAFTLLHLPKDEQNLLSVRRMLRDEELLKSVAEDMKNEERLGGLCQSAASRINSKEGNYFISNAQSNTEWLDSQAMQKALVTTTFDMSQLKWGNASLFLCLPSKYLKHHSNFLRLFVRTAIDVMQEEKENGEIRGNDCLFLLDEFFALGYIAEIAESAGLMAGYGLKLWPILQDLEQLHKLYGKEGAATFFGSADLHQFFGNMDQPTLKFISEKIGNYTVSDLPPEPKFGEGPMGREYLETKPEWERITNDPNAHLGSKMGINERFQLDLEWARKEHDQDMARFNTTASRLLGKPRMTPDEVAKCIAKPATGPSEKIINFVYGGQYYVTRMFPYYVEKMPDLTPPPAPEQSVPEQSAPVQSAPQPSGQAASGGGFWKWLFG